MQQEALNAYDAVSPGDALAPDYGEDVESSGPGRRAGVLLHPTSLPGPYGCGEIGREAFRFIDWLVEAGMQARAVHCCGLTSVVDWSSGGGRIQRRRGSLWDHSALQC